jgi:hypothetical protein
MGNISSCENKNKVANDYCKNNRDIRIKKALDDYDKCVARDKPKLLSDSDSDYDTRYSKRRLKRLEAIKRRQSQYKSENIGDKVSNRLSSLMNNEPSDNSTKKSDNKVVNLNIDTEITKPDVAPSIDDVIRLKSMLTTPATKNKYTADLSETSSALPPSNNAVLSATTDVSNTPFLSQSEVRDEKQSMAQTMKGGSIKKKGKAIVQKNKKASKTKTQTKKYKGKKGGGWSDDSSSSSTSSISSDSDSDFDSSSSSSSEHKKHKKKHENKHENKHEKKHEKKTEKKAEKKADYESSSAHTGGEFSEVKYRNNNYQETSVNTSDINMISEY